MPRDLLIGAADLYQWSDIKPWAATARASGFEGEIYLITYRVAPEVKERAGEYGIQLYEVEHTPYSTAIVHQGVNTPTQAHNLRFYHAWELLTRLDPIEYRYCIMTDVRDVIFQKNPVEFMLDREMGTEGLLASSEGIVFGKEEWNKNNFIQGYGSISYDVAGVDKWKVYNVGVLAGDAESMAMLCHTIYTMTEGRYYPSDQSSFNILVRGILRSIIKEIPMYLPWTAQMGTTNDPTKNWLWERLDEARPVIKDGKVYTSAGQLFHIVHQYDRVPELKNNYV